MSGPATERSRTTGTSKNNFERPLTDRRALPHPENLEVIPRSFLRKAREAFLARGSDNFNISPELTQIEEQMTLAREKGRSIEDFKRDLRRNFAMNPGNRQGTTLSSESSDLGEFMDIVNEVADDVWTR